MSDQLTNRELATVLYALRVVQEQMQATPGEEIVVTGAAAVYFTDVAPLTVAEIDTLCQRLNFGQEGEWMPVYRRQALALFTTWHLDEATERAEARKYADRLWTRLRDECSTDDAGVDRRGRRRARRAQRTET